MQARARKRRHEGCCRLLLLPHASLAGRLVQSSQTSGACTRELKGHGMRRRPGSRCCCAGRCSAGLASRAAPSGAARDCPCFSSPRCAPAWLPAGRGSRSPISLSGDPAFSRILRKAWKPCRSPAHSSVPQGQTLPGSLAVFPCLGGFSLNCIAGMPLCRIFFPIRRNCAAGFPRPSRRSRVYLRIAYLQRPVG